MKENNDKTPTKNKEEKVFDNVRIQWLACIYDDHHLNPYKIGVFKK